MVVKIIANPTAGRGGKNTILQVQAYLRMKGAIVEFFETSRRGDALQAAKDARNEKNGYSFYAQPTHAAPKWPKG